MQLCIAYVTAVTAVYLGFAVVVQVWQLCQHWGSKRVLLMLFFGTGLAVAGNFAASFAAMRM